MGDLEEKKIRKLESELHTKNLRVKRLEYDLESLKSEKNRLVNFINESKKPPAYACIVVDARKKDVLVYSQHGLQTVSYGDVKKEDVKQGKYALIGNMQTGTPPLYSYSTKYQPSNVLAIVEVLDKFAPLLRAKILSMDYGEENDIVVISTDPYYTRSLRIDKQRTIELGLKPNITVDCLPETLDIINVGTVEDVAKYEVIERPTTSLDDIGGLKEAKSELITSLIAPIVNPKDYATYGKTSTKILLFGPPGCGKTMLAKALSHTLENCGFYRVNAAEIHEMWVGKSEENLRNIFKTAIKQLEEKKFDYMTLFFDEFDALAPHRGIHPGSSGVEEKVVGELLTWLEGFNPLPPNLIIIAATNMPDLVDSAVRQRFDKLIEITKPNDKASVGEIVSKYIVKSKVPIDRKLLDVYGSKAWEVLSDEFTGFLFESERIITGTSQIDRKEIITGRLISQTVENAKELALYDRTIIKKNIPHRFKKLFESVDSPERITELKREYETVRDIGINMRYLKDAFNMNKYERAEEIISSQMMYSVQKKPDPRWVGVSYHM